MHADSTQRSGSVLIIVAGLSAVLAMLGLTLVMRMRSDIAETNVMRSTVQARIMFSAAMMYIQETSRIGWGDVGNYSSSVSASLVLPNGSVSSSTIDTDTPVGEGYGWTDVRDGSLGPKGARAAGQGEYTPVPRWYESMRSRLSWPTYLSHPTSAEEKSGVVFPALGRRQWPLPGSAVRAPMPVLEVPPYATSLRYAANPIPYPVPYGSVDDAAWTAAWNGEPSAASQWGFPAGGVSVRSGLPAAWLGPIYDTSKGAWGTLDPRPVKTNWDSFQQGTPLVVAGTDNRCWFRVYRELNIEHDGDKATNDAYIPPSSVTAGWYDTIALYDPVGAPRLCNYNVFIVSAGAGASQGFRFWDNSDPGYSFDLEPVTAKQSGLFGDEGTFREFQRSDTVLWWRVEWTARQGGSSSVTSQDNYINDRNPNNPIPSQVHARSLSDWSIGGTAPNAGDLNGQRNGVPRSYGGGFLWIQRLEREPPKW